MHEHPALIYLALLVLAYGLVSGLAQRAWLSGPMVFTAAGVLVSPLGLNLLELHVSSETVTLIAELTLMMVLFVDGSLIERSALRSTPQALPARLLGIGLPLTALAGFGLGLLLLPELGLWQLALLALMLSPTDAALGQAVVKDARVPQPIRDSISMESGLNDGIALPPIFACFAALGATELVDGDGAVFWLEFMFGQIVLGALVGAGVGFAAGWAMERAHRAGWMITDYLYLTAFALAVLAYACAEGLGGNGFIAAFCAGLFLRVGDHDIRHAIQLPGEATGALFCLAMFLMLGISGLVFALPLFTLETWLYAIGSLTVVRMVPVALCMLGGRFDLPTVLFVGWFGPRGIASVLYLLLAVEIIGVEGHQQVLATVILTVLLSIVLHGLTAPPLARRFGAHAARSMS